MFEALSQPQPDVAEGISGVWADLRSIGNDDACCYPVHSSAVLAAQPARQPEDTDQPASASPDQRPSSSSSSPDQQRQEAAACSALRSSISSASSQAEEPSHAASIKALEGNGLQGPLHHPLKVHGGLADHAAEVSTMTEDFLVRSHACAC